MVTSGWPKNPGVLEDLEDADTIVIYGDGGGGHLAMPHLKDLDRLMKKGIGLVCLHYAVEIPKGEPGDLLKSWIGGYYETFWSVNPTYTAEFKSLPDHPIARGVKPFTIADEWYYHMRFQDGMKGVTPILTTVPPDSTRQGGDDAHGGNPTVRAEKGHAEHVAWAFERPGGGRGFGFTGGHFHWNWGNDNFRKVVLNGYRLDCSRRGPGRRRLLEDPHAGRVGSQPGQAEAGQPGRETAPEGARRLEGRPVERRVVGRSVASGR